MTAAPVVVLLQWRARARQSRAVLDHVAAALTEQVHDLRAAWPRARAAQITADPAVAAAHPGLVWPLTVLDHSSAGLGVHLDSHGHPYAEVTAGQDWTVTASHELVEMLVDPRGRRLVWAPSPAPADAGAAVRVLVEVADPVEALTYEIDGIPVSDFVTPRWYDPHAAGPYSHLHAPDRPLQVLDGGYVSWVGADGHWHQLLPDGSLVRSRRPADLRGDARADKDEALDGEVGAA